MKNFDQLHEKVSNGGKNGYVQTVDLFDTGASVVTLFYPGLCELTQLLVA